MLNAMFISERAGFYLMNRNTAILKGLYATYYISTLEVQQY